MVVRDMASRVRPLLGLLAVIALGLLFLAAGPTGSEEGRAADGLDIATVAARVTPPTVARSTSPASVPRPMAALWVCAVIVLATAGTPMRLLHRLRRRLDDVGDDWRSLLLGAPPAPAASPTA
jgi:hypothetical protein